MRQSLKKSVLLGITTISLVLGSAAAFAQDADGFSQKHKQHHHKRGFFLGVCVGQALLVANPPVALTVGKKPTKDQWAAIKAAKKVCIAAFKAAKGHGGGSFEEAQE